MTQPSNILPSPDEPGTTVVRYARLANLSHWATLFFYCALLALFTVNQWLRADGISLFQWSVQCLPLLLFWFGLRIRRRRTYLWMCFVLLLYFIKGVEGVMAPVSDLFDWLLLCASVGLFIASLSTARWLLLGEQFVEKSEFARGDSSSD